MKWIRGITLLVAIILLFLFGALAVGQPEVALKFAGRETSLQLSVFWWLLLAFVVGLAFGLFNTLWVNLNLRMNNRKLSRELSQLQDKVKQLHQQNQQHDTVTESS